MMSYRVAVAVVALALAGSAVATMVSAERAAGVSVTSTAGADASSAGWTVWSVLGVVGMAFLGAVVAGIGLVVHLQAKKRRACDAVLAPLPGDAADRDLFKSDRRERALVDLPVKYASKNFRMYLDDHMSGIIDQDSVFATADPKVARAMLMSRKHASIRNPRYHVARNLPYNDGILFMEGDVWKKHHSAMLPVLQGPNFGAFAERMKLATEREVAAWPEGRTVDLVEAMRRIARVILFEAGFGIDVTVSPTPEATKLFAAVTKYDEKKAFALEGVSIVEQAARGLWRTWRDGKAVEKALVELLATRASGANQLRLASDSTAASAASDAAEKALLRGEVADGDATAADGESGAPADGAAAGGAGGAQTTDFLARFVEAGMSSKEMASAVTHLKGAHRAIGVMTALAVMELARQPEWAARVRTELAAVRAASGRSFISRGDTSSCPVTMAVLRETTRRHAISLGVMRTTAEPITVNTTEGQSATLPEGTTVLLLLHALHHHPDFWDDPEQFEPARWLVRGSDGSFTPKDGFKPRVPFSYIPFLEGMRQCLGRKLVELEFATMLDVILDAVRPELPRDYEYRIKPDFYPIAERPIQLLVRKRS